MFSDPDKFAQLLQEADQGDQEAANQLFLLVEDELRAIARKRKKKLHQGVDFSTTALIDEAFCAVVGRELTTWQRDDRPKFFCYVATQMHNLLIDAARAQATKKRGGDFHRVASDIGQLHIAQPSQWENVELLMDLQEALCRFEEFAPDDALIFRLRYFLGCTLEETANELNISTSSAKRAFDQARGWLQRELEDYDHDS